MIEDLSLPLYMEVDQIVQQLSHDLSMLATLDVYDLAHDTELESGCFRL